MVHCVNSSWHRAYADTPYAGLGGQYEKELLEPIIVEPLAIGACAYGDGIHDMVQQGMCTVSNINDTSQKFFNGGWYKCKNCGSLFACEGYPEISGQIGYYVTNGGLQVYDGYSSIRSFYTKPENTFYTSSTDIEGYRF